MTSVHSRHDVRIYMKECLSLADNGYQVNLIVADGKGDAVNGNVFFWDVGKPKNRVKRMLATTFMVYKRAKKINASSYHFHDPELMLSGLLLKWRGHKVIYDAHEDLPKQILSKPYLGRTSKFFLYWMVVFVEKLVCGRFDSIVTATGCIAKKFEKINKNVTVINNYPLLSELKEESSFDHVKKGSFFYGGSISRIRGLLEMVGAIQGECGYKLALVGTFNEKKLFDEVKELDGWNNVHFYGQLSRSDMSSISSSSSAGLVLFHPSPNHVDSQPNKLFEYMAAGLPVICSNFKGWKQIIEDYECGLCVNPNDVNDIKKAMDYIEENPKSAKQMGVNGRKMIKSKFNWDVEKQKLLDLYEKL